jgi:hypothetical protein
MSSIEIQIDNERESLARSSTSNFEVRANLAVTMSVRGQATA